ncbi:MAG TPA: ATP-binding protein [Micrococcaceae bacterium]|nr:ATP-binding protein [Micrococcaceae bacterium]
MVFQRNYAMLRGQRWPARRPVASALGSGPEADYTPVLPASSWSAARARLRTGIRTVLFRVLATMLAFTFGGLALAGVITYVLEFQELAGRTDQALQDKVQQIEKTARIGTPGQSGSLPNRLRDAVEEIDPRNHEIMAAFAGGQMRWKMEGSISDVLLPQGLVASATALPDPAGPVFASISAGKPIRVLVVPVRQSGQDTTYLLVGRDSSDERERIFASIRAYAVISAATLAVAALVGGLVAGRLLRPLRRLREASAFVSHDDLTRRVDVGRCVDDVTDLARTFNTMLERLDRGSLEQHQFMDDAGHELRTPLTILRGELELAQRAPRTHTELAETIEVAAVETDRLIRLAEDLLVLARDDSQAALRIRRIDLAATLDDAVATVAPRIQARGLSLELTGLPADGTALMVDADADRMRQAVENLLSNAVRFSPDGGRIDIRVELPGDDVQITVRDQGPGFAPAFLPVAFERFSRGDPARTREPDSGGDPGGSGLGLAIVAGILRAHGGTATARNLADFPSPATVFEPCGREPHGPGRSMAAVGVAGRSGPSGAVVSIRWPRDHRVT